MTREDPMIRGITVSVAAISAVAIVLAAGQSRRMGALNKLLADIDGTPMVRGVVASPGIRCHA